MIRMKVQLTERQRQWLMTQAEHEGISRSEVVRRAVDKLLAKEENDDHNLSDAIEAEKTIEMN